MERRDSTLYQRHKKRLAGSYDEMINSQFHGYSATIHHVSNHSNNSSKSQSERFERAGKWTNEEESFANRLITEFEAGMLQDCEEGCTLRSYLARRLRCAPMRISKKFAGRCIGKLVFVRKNTENVNPGLAKATLDELESLYQKSYNSQDFSDINGDDDISMTDSNGNTSSGTSDSSEYGNYVFVNKRIDSTLRKRIKIEGASPSKESMLDIDDNYSIDNLDADPFSVDITNNNIGCNIVMDTSHSRLGPPHTWDNSEIEAEEWLDVLSFFCGNSCYQESEVSKFFPPGEGGVTRTLSDISRL